jgi:Tfp pilus assembly protein PilN
VRAVNLIPSDQRPGAGGTYGRSGGVAYALVGLACGLVAMTVLWLMARHDVTTRKAQVSQLSAEATQAQNEATALSAYNTFVSMSNTRVANVEQLAQDRFDWAHAFHELGRVLPFDVSLTSVIGTIGTTTGTTSSTATPPATSTTGAASATATSVTPPGSVPTLQLAGCTTSQSEVAYTMQRLALMDGVTNVTLQSSTGGTSDGSTVNVCPYEFSLSVTYTALPTVTPTAATGASPTPTPGTLTAAATPSSTATASSGTSPSASTAATPASTAATPTTSGTGSSTPSSPTAASSSSGAEVK